MVFQETVRLRVERSDTERDERCTARDLFRPLLVRSRGPIIGPFASIKSTPMNRLLTLLLAASLATSASNAQYYVFAHSQSPYAALTTPIPCTFDVDGFDEVTELDGEVFNFFGVNYTGGAPYSPLIGDWGFLRLEGASSAVIIDGLFTTLEAVDATSSVAYSISGVPGNHVLTVEWRNWHLAGGPAGNHATFQISIDQSTGIASVHVGPSSGGGDNIFNNVNGPNCGIFRANSSFTTCYGKVWVEGDPDSPTIDLAPNFDFDALSSFPTEGTLYRFIPSTIAGIEERQPMTLQAFVVADGIRVTCSHPGSDGMLTLFDAGGHEVQRAMMHGSSTVIPTSGLAPGLYLLRMSGTSTNAIKIAVP